MVVDKSKLVRLEALKDAYDKAANKEYVDNKFTEVDNSLSSLSEKIEGYFEDHSKIPSPDKATVGQTIRVSAVDDDGKPTEWEAYSMKISSLCFFAQNVWISYEEIPAKTMKMKLEDDISLVDPIRGGSYITVETDQIDRFPSLWFVTEVSRDGTKKWSATLYVYNFGDEDVTLFEEEITIHPIETYVE